MLVTPFAAMLAAVSPTADDPLTRPIAVEQAKDWLRPAPPVQVFGKTYLVGFGGLSVALIDTGGGTYCVVGEWESFDHLVDARPGMIGMLDAIRDMQSEKPFGANDV